MSAFVKNLFVHTALRRSPSPLLIRDLTEPTCSNARSYSSREALDALAEPKHPFDKLLRIPYVSPPFHAFHRKKVNLAYQYIHRCKMWTVPMDRVELGIITPVVLVIIYFGPSNLSAELKSVEMHHTVLAKGRPGDNMFSVRYTFPSFPLPLGISFFFANHWFSSIIETWRWRTSLAQSVRQESECFTTQFIVLDYIAWQFDAHLSKVLPSSLIPPSSPSFCPPLCLLMTSSDSFVQVDRRTGQALESAPPLLKCGVAKARSWSSGSLQSLQLPSSSTIHCAWYLYINPLPSLSFLSALPFSLSPLPPLSSLLSLFSFSRLLLSLPSPFAPLSPLSFLPLSFLVPSFLRHSSLLYLSWCSLLKWVWRT